MSDWVIDRLNKRHDRSTFSSGQPLPDDWLRLRATQFEKRDLARTCVAVRKSEPLVLGYYSITNHRVQYEALPEELAKG
jgi:hypothetical protein